MGIFPYCRRAGFRRCGEAARVLRTMVPESPARFACRRTLDRSGRSAERLDIVMFDAANFDLAARAGLKSPPHQRQRIAMTSHRAAGWWSPQNFSNFAQKIRTCGQTVLRCRKSFGSDCSFDAENSFCDRYVLMLTINLSSAGVRYASCGRNDRYAHVTYSAKDEGAKVRLRPTPTIPIVRFTVTLP